MERQRAQMEQVRVRRRGWGPSASQTDLDSRFAISINL
jgi:hypothetical protein